MLKIKYRLLTILCLSSLANSEMLRHSSIPNVVLDTETNLIWQDNEDTKTISKNWQNSMDYCNNLALDGADDWRLPDLDTLETLYPKKDSLQNLASDSYISYWTSSPYNSDDRIHYIIDFTDGRRNSSSNKKLAQFYNSLANSDGRHNSDINKYSYYVRCARDSNFNTLTFSSFIESLKTSNSTQNSIILSSSNISETQLFVVTKDGKNYFGTKKELLNFFGIKLHNFLTYKTIV